MQLQKYVNNVDIANLMYLFFKKSIDFNVLFKLCNNFSSVRLFL